MLHFTQLKLITAFHLHPTTLFFSSLLSFSTIIQIFLREYFTQNLKNEREEINVTAVLQIEKRDKKLAYIINSYSDEQTLAQYKVKACC